MSQDLAIKIKQLIDENHLSVFGLEKKAGLRMNAVRNILSGHSKRPSANTLVAISKALGCSISDLIGEDQGVDKHILEEMEFKNFKLFKEVVFFFVEFYEKNELEAKNQVFFESIHHIYKYLNENNKGEFDEKFADWFLTKHIPL